MLTTAALFSMRCDERSVVTITAALSLSCHVFPRTRYPFYTFLVCAQALGWDGKGWNFGTQLELIDWIYLGVNCDLFGHFHMWDGAWGMFFIRRENLHFSWLKMSD